MFYRFARFVVYIFLHLRFRLNVQGVENIPEGGCIVAMNHLSNYDPPVVGLLLPRKMRIMAKEELFKNRLFAAVIRNLGGFPVKRGSADIRSLKYALKLIQEGHIFAIFIEGTRSKTGELQVPKKGIGFIAAKSRAPVIPAYVYGTNRGWRAPAGVIFGTPVTFKEGTDYEEITNEIVNRLRRLAAEQVK